MIEEGALEDVEAIFAMHVSHLLPTSVIGSRSGPLLAGCGFFKAVITGQQITGSSDLVLAASAAVISLQGIVSRESNPLDSQVGYKYKIYVASELSSILPNERSLSLSKPTRETYRVLVLFLFPRLSLLLSWTAETILMLHR